MQVELDYTEIRDVLFALRFTHSALHASRNDAVIGVMRKRYHALGDKLRAQYRAYALGRGDTIDMTL